MKTICATLFVFSLLCSGQGDEVRGEILAPGGADLSRVSAQLRLMDSVLRAAIAKVGADGRFTFPALPAGAYTLQIVDDSGNEIVSQPLNVGTLGNYVTLRLPDRSGPREAPGSISLGELRHKPNKKAARAAADAHKFSAAGDRQHAVAALEKAVALDPQFPEAHGNLGAELALLHRYDQAGAELRRGIELAPTASWIQSNLAIVLLQSGNRPEAEQWARSAVALNAGDVKARYVLGWRLTRNVETQAEGIRQLELAARALPAAQQALDALARLK